MVSRKQCDPVGLSEMAERLGVSPQTPVMWNHRGLLPEPSWIVSGRPAWNWPDVQEWARQTGRLKGKPRRRQK